MRGVNVKTLKFQSKKQRSPISLVTDWQNEKQTGRSESAVSVFVLIFHQRCGNKAYLLQFFCSPSNS